MSTETEIVDPYTGYDCSELIMRMAQIAGISFSLENNNAIKHAPTEFTQGDSLKTVILFGCKDMSWQ